MVVLGLERQPALRLDHASEDIDANLVGGGPHDAVVGKGAGERAVHLTPRTSPSLGSSRRSGICSRISGSGSECGKLAMWKEQHGKKAHNL